MCILRYLALLSALFLAANTLPAAQIVSGSITWTTLYENTNRGQTDFYTADTHVVGTLVLMAKSLYLGSPTYPLNGTVNMDASGSLCGGSLELTGAIKAGSVVDCGFPYLSNIGGGVTAPSFLYAGGYVTELFPFTFSMDITALQGPNYYYNFTGSGIATLIGHSQAFPGQTSFVLDNYTLNFANVPEPVSGLLLLAGLGGLALLNPKKPV